MQSMNHLSMETVINVLDVAKDYNEHLITLSDVQDILEGLELTSGYKYEDLYFCFEYCLEYQRSKSE